MLRACAAGELQAVTDLAPESQWCWATQAAEALTAMQQLVSETISQGRDAVDPAAIDAQVHAYRSAALIGASQTAARSSPLMKKAPRVGPPHAGPPGRLSAVHQGLPGFPDNDGTERDIRMAKLKQKVSGCLRTLTGAR